MKKIGAFTTMVLMMTAIIAGISLFCAEPAKAFAQGSSGKVLLIPREGYSQDLDLVISKEVSVMTKLLNNAGFTVDIATTLRSLPSQVRPRKLKMLRGWPR